MTCTVGFTFENLTDTYFAPTKLENGIVQLQIWQHKYLADENTVLSKLEKHLTSSENTWSQKTEQIEVYNIHGQNHRLLARQSYQRYDSSAACVKHVT